MSGLATTIFPLTVAAARYYIVNAGLVAGAIALSSGASYRSLWLESFLPVAPNYFLAAAVGAALAMLLQGSYALLIVAALPMVVCQVAYAGLLRWNGATAKIACDARSGVSAD